MKREMYNDAPKRAGLYLTGCGIEETDAVSAVAPYMENSCIIYGLLSGHAVFETRGQQFEAEAGDAFAVLPGEIVKYRTDGAWSVCWISFSGADLRLFLDEVTGGGDVRMMKGCAPAVGKCVNAVLDYRESERGRLLQTRLTSYLFDALSSLSVTHRAGAASKSTDRARRAQSFIEYNYMHGISAADVAAYLNIDRTHFYRIFKSCTGQSPESYIMNYRVTKGCELLLNTSLKVTEIARAVGIADVYYFSKLFKKITGTTPTGWREAHRETLPTVVLHAGIGGEV